MVWHARYLSPAFEILTVNDATASRPWENLTFLYRGAGAVGGRAGRGDRLPAYHTTAEITYYPVRAGENAAGTVLSTIVSRMRKGKENGERCPWREREIMVILLFSVTCHWSSNHAYQELDTQSMEVRYQQYAVTTLSTTFLFFSSL